MSTITKVPEVLAQVDPTTGESKEVSTGKDRHFLNCDIEGCSERAHAWGYDDKGAIYQARVYGFLVTEGPDPEKPIPTKEEWVTEGYNPKKYDEYIESRKTETVTSSLCSIHALEKLRADGIAAPIGLELAQG